MIRIGLIDTPRTGPFIYDLIDEMELVAGDAISVEMALLDAVPMNFSSPYQILIDRLSHLIPFYRTYLKTALLNGSYVINNPFWFSADDKFFNCSLMLQEKIALPKTVCLPSHSYLHGIQREKDLQNLKYPVDWEKIIEYIGFPAVLKPYDGKGWKNVFFVNNREELMAAYEKSGQLVMMLQEKIQFEAYVRCMVLGQRYVLPIEYTPQNHQYHSSRNFLPPALEAQIIQNALTIVQTLGYDMNTVEFAIRDGIPYAIDFMNPIPDFTPERILRPNYEWVVEHSVKMLVDLSQRLRQGAVLSQNSFPSPLLRGY